MSAAELDAEQRKTLLALARASIRHGLRTGKPLQPQLADYTAPLTERGGTFVTLRKQGELRGCIGTLEPYQPLVSDVAEHAYAAAFRDPRFPPLSPNELDELEVDISILGAPTEIDFADEADLVSQLRPGVDGLILQEGARRGTFLPSVWEQLPEPAEFLRHLKLKAGLPMDYWSDTLRVWRYEVEYIEE